MKRIVDIPDKVVEAIQNGEDYRYDIHTAIAQSKPYNPSGDLISRSALKNYWENRILTDCSYISSGEILQSIDDAQTVDPTGDCIFREALKDIAYINKGNFNTVEGIREWIDNAPTAYPIGDAISREALKKALELEYDDALGLCSNEVLTTINLIIKLVDNAQAVPLRGDQK